MPHSTDFFLYFLEKYHWTFDGSSTTESFDNLNQKTAILTGARIADIRPSLLMEEEEEGHFVTDFTSSELSGDKGVTVSFSMKQAGNVFQVDL